MKGSISLPAAGACSFQETQTAAATAARRANARCTLGAAVVAYWTLPAWSSPRWTGNLPLFTLHVFRNQLFPGDWRALRVAIVTTLTLRVLLSCLVLFVTVGLRFLAAAWRVRRVRVLIYRFSPVVCWSS